MRVRLSPLASLLFFAACGGGGGDFVDGGSDMPSVASAEPAFGPLSGGTRVIVTGNGFANGGAAPNHVLVGGHEAAAAGIIDDNTIEVVIPEGDSPGDAEIVVYNSNGYASATGIFHYSEPPTITSMSPDEVRYDTGGTITVTGSGFLDEDAGVNAVLIDGISAIDVDVTSDTSLSFTALPGLIFNKPDITVVNRRGTAIANGYQYGPGPAGGLIAFARSFSTAPTRFAFFFDPLTLEIQSIPVRAMQGGGGGSFPWFRSVFQNAAGQYLGVDRDSNQVRLLDLDAQTSSPMVSLTYQVKEIAQVGGTTYALNRTSSQFGSINMSTGVFTQIGTANISGQGAAIAADSGGTVYVTNGGQITTISRTTGVLGTLVPLSPNLHISGMRFLGTTLYAVTRNNQIADRKSVV